MNHINLHKYLFDQTKINYILQISLAIKNRPRIITFRCDY